jgi:hypothetical protein
MRLVDKDVQTESIWSQLPSHENRGVPDSNNTAFNPNRRTIALELQPPADALVYEELADTGILQ